MRQNANRIKSNEFMQKPFSAKITSFIGMKHSNEAPRLTEYTIQSGVSFKLEIKYFLKLVFVKKTSRV